jgi:hypothetical protein
LSDHQCTRRNGGRKKRSGGKRKKRKRSGRKKRSDPNSSKRGFLVVVRHSPCWINVLRGRVGG